MRGIVPCVAIAALLGAGCDLGVAGLEASSALTHDGGPGNVNPLPDIDAGLDSSSGASSDSPPSGDGAAPADAGTPDATILDASGGGNDADATTNTSPDASDGSSGGDACAETSDAAATATVPAWPNPPPPMIDGVLSEWPCGYVHFSSANAAYATNASYPLAIDIQVRWDMQNVYVAAHITDPNVGDAPYDSTNPYNNDSIEVYVSGDATLDGDYDSNTHQYITDYKGLTVDYGPSHTGSAGVTSPAHVKAAATVVTGGWDYEAAVSADALGLNGQGQGGSGTGFSSGTNIALGFEVIDGTGTNEDAALVLVMAPPAASCTCQQAQCCCGMTPDVPYCDSARIERVTLE